MPLSDLAHWRVLLRRSRFETTASRAATVFARTVPIDSTRASTSACDGRSHLLSGGGSVENVLMRHVVSSRSRVRRAARLGVRGHALGARVSLAVGEHLLARELAAQRGRLDLGVARECVLL